jgi:hypothetical protein
MSIRVLIKKKSKNYFSLNFVVKTMSCQKIVFQARIFKIWDSNGSPALYPKKLYKISSAHTQQI